MKKKQLKIRIDYQNKRESKFQGALSTDQGNFQITVLKLSFRNLVLKIATDTFVN